MTQQDMPERKWSQRLRNTFLAGSVIWTASTPLIAAYKFFSLHGHVVPLGSGNPNLLEIGVNMCILSGMLALSGLMYGYTWVAFAIRFESVLWNIFRGGFLITLLVIGVPAYHVDDYVLLIAASSALLTLCLSPVARFFLEYFVQVVLVVGLISTAVILSVQDFERSLWMSVSNQPDFVIAPLPSVTAWGWFNAVVGVLVYAEGYVVFQQWRTQGKWLEELQRQAGNKTGLLSHVVSIQLSLWGALWRLGRKA